MPVQAPPMFGGIVTLGSNATRLADEDTPMCQLSIRSNSAAEYVK